MTSTEPTQRPEDPGDVLADDTRSREEKQKYLEDWRLDLIERVRATEENMVVDGSPQTDDPGDLLRRVTAALTEIRGA